jgi:hypothetical protein
MSLAESRDERPYWDAIQARLEVVIDALELPYSEIHWTNDDDSEVRLSELIEFAKRCGQSLDWIIEGDVRPMLRRAWRKRNMEA